jgi:uncharacterized membrane protein (DUF4010 family)
MPALTAGGEQLQSALRLAIAALVGVGVGLERQWSGHASGPDARFAGLRTFFLLGTLGGASGLLLSLGFEIVAATLIAAGAALSIVAFVVTMRRPGVELDATTEAAALVVVALGALAGVGWIMLAAAAGSVVVLLLHEKTRLHSAVAQVGETELRAALRFGVLALVVLPLLPATASIAGVEWGPRSLWMIVLFFSALNFAAYLVRRGARADRGYALTGAIGGLISSTAVTLDFSRRSRAHPELRASLAAGVIGACAVLVPRVLVVSTVLNPAVAAWLAWYLLPALLVGSGVLVMLWRRSDALVAPPDAGPANPLRLGAAIRMAVAFQVAMLLIEFVAAHAATPGLYATSALLGMTDVDALTVSMNRVPDDLPARTAARAIATGVLANTVTKATMAIVVGAGRFRWIASGTLVAIGIVTAVIIWAG